MKTRIIIIAIFFSTCCTRAQQRSEVKIIASDASGLTVEYTPRITEKSFSINGSTYRLYLFDEAEQKSVKSAGFPDVRFRDIIVGLPSLEGNRAEVIQTEYEDVQNVRLAPVPDWKKNEEGEFIPIYSDRKTGNVNELLPTNYAELLKPGIGRDRIISSLRITPVRWNPATRTLRKYSRIVVRVEFGARDPRMVFRQTKEIATSSFILNDDQSKLWRIIPQTDLRKSTGTSFANGDWYRIEVNEDGMYKIPRNWFEQAGININSLDPRTIKMYGNGGKELPIDLSDPRPDHLQEIAVEIIGEDDGKFDANDYVLFFGQGLTGFTYDASIKRYKHYIHRFDRTNAYLITFGGTKGNRIQTRSSLNDANPIKPQWFTGKAFVEDEKVNFIRSGRLWVSEKISSGGSKTYQAKLDQLVTSQPILIRSELYSRADNGTSNNFVIDDHGTELCTITMGTIDLNTDTGDIAWKSPVQECTLNVAPPDDRSILRLTYNADNPNRNEGGYIDWIEWYYAHAFAPTNDLLIFSAPDQTGTIEYLINGFSNSDVTVYDVSDYKNVVKITNANISGGTVRFQSAAVEGKPNQFIAVASSGMKSIGASKKLSNSNLLTNSGAEFIIITPPEFLDAAKKLQAYREREGEDKISTMVATTQEIFNEFNSGVADPVAMRNFIQYAYTNWQIKPNYVLLFGDGHYDYLNITTNDKIWVPVFETENSLNLIDSYVTDDFFVQIMGNDNLVDVKIGRLPVASSESAQAMVDKIIQYETGQTFEPWRNTVTFVADDGPTSQGDDTDLHTSQAEQLARSIPPEMEQKKIYIVAYKTVFTSQGRRKPDAFQAIIDQINAGTVITNYTGHGNESVWTHERVLISDISIPQMNNANRLSFLCAATCAFALYDMPGIISGAEMMVIKPDGAMIGALASPRVVFAGENALYNTIYFQNLLNNGRENDGRAKRLGDANYTTKQRLFGSAGYEKFHLFADPTVRLVLPRHKSIIEEILVNGSPVTSDTVQLKALSKVTFNASVRKYDNSVWTDFNGSAQVSLFDAKRNVPVPEWGSFEYELPGGLLYRGQSTIRNGKYSVSFVVPKDITYENNTGRISLYIENNQTDGIGYSTKLRISGSDTSTGIASPPKVLLFMDTRSFKPGDVVNENSHLLVDLFDDYGINTTGNGIGHDIEAWLDNNQNSFVLNDYYKSKIDSYQEGSVDYLLRNLEPGKHTLKVRAWNIHNISSTDETYFEVASSSEVAVRNVFNFPNPMTNATSFTFSHNMSNAINVEIKIYTIAGHLIKKLESKNITDRFVNIPWDGRDEEGDLVSNGMYLYKLIVMSMDGSKGSEIVEKLAVLR